MEDFSTLVARAAQWFTRQLPAHEQLSAFSIHVAGVKLDRPGMPTDFHTFACLYPDRGIWVAMRIQPQEHGDGAMLTGPQLREIIADFEPSEHWVKRQREVADQVLPGSTEQERWVLACGLASSVMLPVGLFVFGHTVETRELSVYLFSVELAPLRKIAAEFKRVAPRVV